MKGLAGLASYGELKTDEGSEKKREPVAEVPIVRSAPLKKLKHLLPPIDDEDDGKFDDADDIHGSYNGGVKHQKTVESPNTVATIKNPATLFVPPQVRKGKPNVSTEDMDSYFAKKNGVKKP